LLRLLCNDLEIINMGADIVVTIPLLMKMHPNVLFILSWEKSQLLDIRNWQNELERHGCLTVTHTEP
jgi:hypothetical protein